MRAGPLSPNTGELCLSPLSALATDAPDGAPTSELGAKVMFYSQMLAKQFVLLGDRQFTSSEGRAEFVRPLHHCDKLEQAGKTCLLEEGADCFETGRRNGLPMRSPPTLASLW